MNKPSDADTKLKELQENEERFRLAMDATSDGLWDWDIETNHAYFSPGYYRILGYEPDEFPMTSQEWINRIHPDDREQALRANVDCLNNKRDSFEVEFRMKTKTGSWKWVLGRGKAVSRAADGKAIRMIGTHVDITQRKQAEATIQREKVFTDAVLDSVPGLLYLYDENGYLVRWNKKHEELTGYSTEELSHMHVLDWYKGDEKETAIIKAGIEKAFREGFADAEARLTTKNGSRVPFYFTAVRLTIDAKNYFVGVGIDITERKRAEQALRESEEKFSKSFHSAPITMAISKMVDGTYLDVNDAFLKLSGLSRKEVIGKTSIELGIMGQEDRSRLIMELKEKGRIAGTELTLLAKDGRRIHCFYQVEIITIQGQQRLLSIGVDMSERKRARQALMESEAKYRALFEESKDVIFISTPGGRILDVNQAGVELFGYSSKEDIFSNVDLGRDVYANQEDRSRYQAELELTGFVKDYPFVMKKKNGEKLDVLMTASVVRDGKENIVGYRGIVRDITAHKKLEQQLLQAQKMEAVGQLAGGIAHDFNNILSAITGYSYLLKTKLNDDDPSTADVEQILDSANRAAELTHSLLAFSRKQLMNPKPVNINDIVKRTDKLLKRLIGEDIEITAEFVCNDAITMADASQIEQVLLNLATNARDAMPHGGKLILSTKCVEVDEPFIRNHGYGGPGMFALISVSDTGVGMCRATAARIFEPFFTTKETGKGTGLGLAMVYGIIKQHDGFIDVHTEPGKGTTFNIYLPAVESKEEETVKAIEALPAGGIETILVTEDDEKLRKLSEIILNQHGYKVILAQDGQEGIDKFIENKDRIHLVMLDMIMPKKCGKEVYDEIKRVKPDMKVIFLSGYTADRIDKESLVEENMIFIYKPVSPKELLRKVREVLDNETVN